MSRPKPARDAALAFTLLTVLPLPVRWPEAEDAESARPDVASYFALVGLVVGVGWSVTMWVSWRYFYGVSGTLAALVLIATALFTRLMHWDGIADVADAWFVSAERRHEVMHDSASGAFGATAIALVALLQWSALVELGAARSSVALVVLAPACGRMAASCAAWFGTPARPDGLGRSVMRRPNAVGLLATTVALAAAAAVSLALGAQVAPLVLVFGTGLALALGVPHLISMRFGGVTGDVMGASVIVVESAVLVLTLAILAALRLAGVAS